MRWRDAFIALERNRQESIQRMQLLGCEHKRVELRAVPVAGGSKQYANQCLRCGERVGTAVSQVRWHAENGPAEPPAFDEQLRRNWRDSREADGFDARKERYQREWWDLYNRYLRSQEWAEKRVMVLDREGHTCQGCKQADACQVHHLSYEHVGGELLFELVALCYTCHEAAHHDRAQDRAA